MSKQYKQYKQIVASLPKLELSGEALQEKVRLKRKNLLRKILFCTVLLIVPTIHYLITFFYVNGSSIFMAFQQTDYITGQVEWVGFENFETLFKTFFKTADGSAPFYVAVLNSLEYWALGTFVGLPLGFFFGYFFFKRIPGYGLIRAACLIPSLIPGIVLPLLYGFMLDSNIGIVNTILKDLGLRSLIPVNGWLGTPSLAQPMLLLYSLWSGFCGNLVLISSNLNRAPSEIFESAMLDGCPVFKEFIYIALPLVWPLFTLLFVGNFQGIFTNYMLPYLLTEGGPLGHTMTIGYYVFSTVQEGANGSAAAGILSSCIGIPLVLFFRWLFFKLVPRVEF